MAGGWTRDGAVQDQIDDTVKDASSARGGACRQDRARHIAKNAERKSPS
jgi:hypothetical protein